MRIRNTKGLAGSGVGKGVGGEDSYYTYREQMKIIAFDLRKIIANRISEGWSDLFGYAGNHR